MSRYVSRYVSPWLSAHEIVMKRTGFVPEVVFSLDRVEWHCVPALKAKFANVVTTVGVNLLLSPGPGTTAEATHATRYTRRGFPWWVGGLSFGRKTSVPMLPCSYHGIDVESLKQPVRCEVMITAHDELGLCECHSNRSPQSKRKCPTLLRKAKERCRNTITETRVHQS